jgi:hypothetical protein
MTTSLVKLAAVAAFSLCASFAMAQTPANSVAKPAATAPAATANAPGMKPRTAASFECSKKADAQGLHGKARKIPLGLQTRQDGRLSAQSSLRCAHVLEGMAAVSAFSPSFMGSGWNRHP